MAENEYEVFETSPAQREELERAFNPEDIPESKLSDLEIDRIAELVAEKLKIKCGCESIIEPIEPLKDIEE